MRISGVRFSHWAPHTHMILSHIPLTDVTVQQAIVESFNGIHSQDVDLELWNNQRYFDAFQQWIKASRYNSFVGLDLFTHHAFSNGSIDGIQSFIHRHGVNRRIRFSAAEFIGSKIVCNHADIPWTFLEDEPIKADDAVVLSLPFAGDGNIFSDLDRLLNDCDALGVPVLIDCAYFGISYDTTIDLTRSCITDVVFSLSKPFSTPLRLGYRLTKTHFDDILQANSDLKIYNRYSAHVGIELMSKFSHNWLIEKYRPLQERICRELDLTPSKTLTLAVDRKQRPEFLRNNYYRVCITNELQQHV